MPSSYHLFHKFKCGDTVRRKVDPRHTGRVCYTDTEMVRVQWYGTGWKSDHHHGELEKCDPLTYRPKRPIYGM
jgi:hypothetical protein